jgi:hypothetical protein
MALLAIEGKFETITLGRDLDLNKVHEMKCLYYDKHEFSLSKLRTPGGTLVDEAAFEVKRVLPNSFEWPLPSFEANSYRSFVAH